ncbi:MAG TPA: acyl-phosphate glycerol 3-phosphate acyltransferase, partial [Candidatus Acetothermia bacterium]|nr:acyl-phosphate glycerol 3-phosphate acyltransferase [Candidatus Acetothermia bacterium]
TGAGVVLALAPLPAALSAAVFTLAVLGTGIVSLGSLSAAVTLPVAAFLLDRYASYPVSVEVRALAVGLAVLVFYTHRSNLRRLLAGRENRFRRLWERKGE